MAHRVSGMCDRYIAVANNRTIKWAITKEKLTKRGLVSPLDYYFNNILEIKLNRRMPNGTYGGVRRRRNSALLDYAHMFSVSYMFFLLAVLL